MPICPHCHTEFDPSYTPYCPECGKYPEDDREEKFGESLE
jgi:hypothetical protein